MPSQAVDYTVVDHAQKWRILKHQWRFAVWSLWISIGSFMLGFDYVAGGQLAALSEFKKQFGVQDSVTGAWYIPAHYLSAWNAVGPAMEFLGAVVAAPFFERYGRKPMVLVSVLLTTVGVLMQQLSREWTLHLGGRLINGWAIGIMFTICPLYLGENSRPELRGFCLCFFNTSIVIGQFLIVLVSRGSESLDNIWQWQTVIVVQYIWPFLLLAGYWWFPESPYWLIREGRPEAAHRALQTLYGKHNPLSFFDTEYKRIETDVKVTQSLTGSFTHQTFWGLPMPTAEIEAFRGKNFKRTLTAIWAASAQQMIGATFVIGYATYFFDLIGFKNYFDASVVLYVCMVLSTCAAFYLVEVAGRRTLLVWPGFILCFILLIIGVAGTVPNKQAGSWAIIVFTYLWAILYQLSIGATGFVLASEVATLRLRAATQSLVTATNAVWGLIMQFTIPYMINPDAGNLGGKTGYIFAGLGLIASIGGYILYPETKGVPFEVLDQLYLAGVKPRDFKKFARDERFASAAVVEASEVGTGKGEEEVVHDEHKGSEKSI